MNGDSGERAYEVVVEWVGNRGTGTSDYRAYGRDHIIGVTGKTPIPGSADPAFRGDPTRWNPEELLIASLSACHKLWYLHLCAVSGIGVLAYRDRATGLMVEDASTGGRFSRVILHPHVTVRSDDDIAIAEGLHRDAHAKCFIARSVNFPVEHEAIVERATLLADMKLRPKAMSSQDRASPTPSLPQLCTPRLMTGDVHPGSFASSPRPSHCFGRDEAGRNRSHN